MDTEPEFDRKYFHSEVLALRDAFGTIKFWEKPETAQAARKAISYVYARTINAISYDQVLFEATLQELTRREVLVVLHNGRGTIN